MDFCQSDRLKMVSAFSYEHSQTIFFFFLTLKAVFFFSCEMSLDGPYPFFYWVIDFLSFFTYLGDWPFVCDKSCRFFFFQLVIRFRGLFLLFGFPPGRTLFSCSEIDQSLGLLGFES